MDGQVNQVLNDFLDSGLELADFLKKRFPFCRKEIESLPLDEAIVPLLVDLNFERETTLLTIFPELSMRRLVASFHKNDCDLERTIDSLASSSSAPASTEDLPGEEESPIVFLCRLFPGKSRRAVVAALEKGGSVERGAELLLEKSSATCSKPIVLSGFAGSSASAPATASAESFNGASLNREQPTKDSAYYRQEASEFARKRAELFSKAAQEFQKRSLTGRATASYYSQQGHMLTAQMEEANRMAAQAIIRENRIRTSLSGSADDTIDLHGLTVQEATEFALEYIPSYFSKMPKAPLRIITGSGKHSPDGPRLYPAILHRLKRLGYPIVSADLSLGCIVVKNFPSN